MRSGLTKLLITALATTIWLLASAAMAEPGEEAAKPKPRREPVKVPVAVQACAGANLGDECSFTRGKLERTGTCVNRRDTLRCVPKGNRRPPHAGPPSDKKGGMKADMKPAPPEEPSAE
jgi:hypothetical protein